MGRRTFLARLRWRRQRWAEHLVDEVADPRRFEGDARHQPAQDDRSRQRLRQQLRVEIGRQLAGLHTFGEQTGKRHPAGGGESNVQLTRRRVALSGIDQGRQARRPPRRAHVLGQVLERGHETIPHRALRRDRQRRLELQEGVVDQLDPARPMSVDRALGDSRLRGDRLDRQLAVSALDQQAQGSVEHGTASPLDPGIRIPYCDRPFHDFILARERS